MYYYGVGVEKNIEKAIEWTLKAYEADDKWSLQLFDLLFEYNNSQYETIMLPLIKEFAQSKDGEKVGRAGKAYLEGTYVEKNLNQAIKYLQYASKKRIQWAQIELDHVNKYVHD